MVNQTLKVGIVGPGRHGSRYAAHIAGDLPGLELAAISRRSPEGEGQARGWGAAWHRSWAALVADPRVNAVVAAATPDINPALALACAEQGKPLLVEKPLAVTAAAAASMIRAFAARDLPLTVGQTLRFNSTVRALRRHLPEVGQLHSFTADQRLEPPFHRWLDDPWAAGGGVILHTAVHTFDALRFITGREVRRVRAAAYRRGTTNLEDLFTAQLELDDGVAGLVEASKVGPARSGRFEFVGSQGTLRGDQVYGTLEFVGAGGPEPRPHEPPVATLVPLLRQWEACLRGRGANPVPAVEGLAALRLCEACMRSVKLDRWFEVRRGEADG
jgi:predicted dehydrogenase